MQEAARAAGKGEAMAKLMADYPRGPHDQPQSMCPAFGSLRVGLRMRRVATILSGSACCVYGLTFTSHFYGAKRSVGYVPFNSETLVTGKLFEALAVQVAEAPPKRPTPLTHEALLDLFKGEAVGRGVVLEPATMEDMCAAEGLNRPSLEVVYDGA